MTTTASSPLFDSLAAGLRSSAGRPTTPFAAAATTRSVAPGTAPTWMTSSTVATPSTRGASTGSAATASVSTATTGPRIRREVQTSLPSVASLVSDPIPAHELTAEERDIIASMGGTVARLLLEMMNDGRPRR